MTAPLVADLLEGPVYAGYLYGYPHKTAYRPLDPPVPLDEAWADEDRSALFLYLHVPFCEMRCGFCNLFTASRPPEATVAAWLDALERQARVVGASIGDRTVAQLAIGGGTPTMLEPAQLERLFAVAVAMGAGLGAIPSGIETSPATATPDRLRVLRDAGVTRVSIGVQSFLDEEVRAAQRPQAASVVEAALGRIRDAGFPTLNLDLIYGLPGQTRATWLASIRAALRFRPEELFLYPLYVRPLTGLGIRGKDPADAERLALYRAGRDLLRDEGYLQVSLRQFRRAPAPRAAGRYRCQEDGMIGLGCGARSYTAGLHYATEYAVSPRAVRDVIDRWIARADAAHAVADHGIRLDAEDRRRRYAILSLLADGLDLDGLPVAAGVSPTDPLEAQLAALVEAGLARREGRLLRLTDAGVERSDAIGPWLVSDRVRARMDAYEAR